LPQQQDLSYRLPPRRFVSMWDTIGPGHQREAANQIDLQLNPTFEFEAEFWFEVPFREPKLRALRVQAQNIPVASATDLALRNAMIFHIDEAIDALPRDEAEVRSALPAELKGEKVRRRWKDADKLAEGHGPDVFPLALAAKAPRPADEAEREAWLAVWLSENPQATDAEAYLAAEGKFGGKGVSERRIAALRALPDGSKRTRGPKRGKTYARRS
jgi:hypothetical protein